MSRGIKALEKLKTQVAETYQSSFDFASYEISDKSKKLVMEKENIIIKNFQKFSDSLYEICRALYEVSLELKAEGSFMAWYSHIGLSKDKVSELLKRNELYMHFQDKQQYISSLSNQAVKLLTHKNVPVELLYDIAELGLKKADDIKAFLVAPKEAETENSSEEEDELDSEKAETNLKIRYVLNTSLREMGEGIEKASPKEVSLYQKEIASLKRELARLEDLCKSKIDEEWKKSNTKLFQ